MVVISTITPDLLEELDELLPEYEEEEFLLPDDADKERIDRVLSSRWDKCLLSEKQANFLTSTKRFNVCVAGRRSFKTEGAKRRGIRKAIRETRFDFARFLFSAPTAPQATKIFWYDLKRLTPVGLIKGGSAGIREAEKSIPLINGMELGVVGLDVPERVEGSPLAHICVDELDNVKQRAWEENISPALTDTQGTADFIGVPEGRLLLWKFKEKCETDEYGEWSYHHWTSEEVLHLYLGFRADREALPDELKNLDPISLGVVLAERELKSAMSRMDKVTYNREYRASFETIEGRVYYDFDRTIHSRYLLRHQPDRPLDLCLDFNVEPGTATVVQDFPTNYVPGEVGFTGVIDEIWIERDSNTIKICEEFGKRWGGRHSGRVRVFGDATGGARGSAKVEGSDWDLVKKVLPKYFPAGIDYKYPRRNPPERVRMNAMNSRILSANGLVKFRVDPSCRHTITDFESVKTKEDGSGEIYKEMKGENKWLTHLSDGLGYREVYLYPLPGAAWTSQDAA